MTILRGKSALVTGGSRGIGAAIARQLGEQGADVAITYLRSAEQARQVADRIESAGSRSLLIQADHESAQASAEAVKQTERQFGGLDILVHNAGIFAYGPIESHSLEEIDRILAIHVRSVFVATQTAVQAMRNGGRIIFIGSSLAERVPGSGLSLYSMTKSALIGLTKGLARDLGPRGITVNVVQPGSTDTDMNPADGPGADEERAFTALLKYGAAEDIASAVVYLAGDSGRHVTGTSLIVDGGTCA